MQRTGIFVQEDIQGIQLGLTGATHVGKLLPDAYASEAILEGEFDKRQTCVEFIYSGEEL